MAKKNYQVYTNQCALYQNDKVTLAVYANLVTADKYHFAELINDKESKIKMDINNFTNGKGNQASHVYYNLSVSEVYDVFENLKSNSNFEKFYSAVSLDAYPKREGEYAGLCDVRSITITYSPNMNYPYKIYIVNGYGKKGKIEKGERAEQVFLKKDAIKNLFRKTTMFIEKYIDCIPNDFILDGVKQVEDGKQTYQEQMPQNNYGVQQEQIPQQQMQPQNDYGVQQEQIPQQQMQYQQPVSEEKSEIHAVNGRFISEFINISGAYVVQMEINNKIYNIYFKDVPKELVKAQELGVEVMINIYQFKGNLCFDSLI